MFICNIVYDEGIDFESEDGKIIKSYLENPSLNVITDITRIKTEVPTLFYGKKLARKIFGEVDSSGFINKFYQWSYTSEEVEHMNYIHDFVEREAKKWFSFVDNGIDVVFNEFDIENFTSKLSPWPLIHEGNYEIYIAEWVNKKITIHSIKKETLEYIGVDPKKFILGLAKKLDYKFITFESNRYWAVAGTAKEKQPIFVDLLMEAVGGNWIGIGDIIDHFKGVKIDRKKVIVYYLKQSEYLRPIFNSIAYQ